MLGLFIHYIRIPFPAFGHRPPQNFLHAVQGLVILGLANYQVRLCRLHSNFFLSFLSSSVNQIYDGIYHKTGFLAPHVVRTAKQAWLALNIVRQVFFSQSVTLAEKNKSFITDFLGSIYYGPDLLASPVYAGAKSQAGERARSVQDAQCAVQFVEFSSETSLPLNVPYPTSHWHVIYVCENCLRRYYYLDHTANILCRLTHSKMGTCVLSCDQACSRTVLYVL